MFFAQPGNIGLAKKFINFFPYNSSSSAYLSLTSFEIIFDSIVTAVISVSIKKIKIGEFLVQPF